MRGTLPEPGRQRWQPLRAGLVDLFYYDAEEFWFRDGRLLLRGNNGTGKSKVLALTLPFLLDGDLSAHRVEPDADPKREAQRLVKLETSIRIGGSLREVTALSGLVRHGNSGGPAVNESGAVEATVFAARIGQNAAGENVRTRQAVIGQNSDPLA